MTKRDLIDEVVKLFPRFSRRDAEVMVNAVFESLAEALRRGERIEIRGFGSFVVKQRQAREGRNPKTGALVPVRPSACRSSRSARSCGSASTASRGPPTTPRCSTSAGRPRDGGPVGPVAHGVHRGGERETGCIFCRALEGDPRERLLLGASPASVVMLNRYPYASAHLMVAPRRHTASLSDLPAGRVPGPERDAAARAAHARRGAAPRRDERRHEPGRVRRRRHRGSPALAHRAALDRRHQLHAAARRGACHAGAPARHVRPSPSGVRLAHGVSPGDVERASGSLVVSRATTCV